MQLSLLNSRTIESDNIRKLDINWLNPGSVDRVRPFLRYPGSKYNAAKYIEPFWKNIEFNEYREPFLGSGAVFFKMPKVEFSWLNDIDNELINGVRSWDGFFYMSNDSWARLEGSKIWVKNWYIWDNIIPEGTTFVAEYDPTNIIDEDVNWFRRAPTIEDDGFTYTPYPYPHPLTEPN